jgi:hypothetical protein
MPTRAPQPRTPGAPAKCASLRGWEPAEEGESAPPWPDPLFRPDQTNCLKLDAHGASRRDEQRQLSTTDILALATMKNAAKCDT